MPNLCVSVLCCGCSACYAACPKKSITMAPDAEGFLHPQVDMKKCVNCGLCEKVCPVLHRDEPRRPIAVYAAQAKDDELRMQSSSGGVFSLLARQIIDTGGIVFGAGFKHDTWEVVHKSAGNEEELEDLRGSKYVQSDMGNTYSAVRKALTAGLHVLFSGTPCQIAGLRRYLEITGDASIRSYWSNLLLVDVICHAVPSPLAWKKFLEERTADTMGRDSALAVGQNIRRISFRRKNCGWKRFSLSLRFANDKEYLGNVASDEPGMAQDVFLAGFLRELYNRPSCHRCVSKELRSGSDLTIADYWCVGEFFDDFDDDKGTSCILVNTERGAKALAEVRPLLRDHPSSFEQALKHNPAILHCPKAHFNRRKFFKRILAKNFNFNRDVPRMIRGSLLRRGICKILRILKVVK